MYDTDIHRTGAAPEGVVTQGLGRRFGDVWAVRDVDLVVPAGTVLGLLGHNGAGKTTLVRMLSTLLVPSAGRAWVAGLDVVADAAAVRGRIGLAGQYASVDDLMSARANLEMIGRLHHLPRRAARARADELLERLSLADVADRLVKTFSGGMRRRLDLAASLIARPPVLFLDEPTTGLDPGARRELWELLADLVSEGATLLLTTQYLEEADRLADRIVVLDHGVVVAEGTPAELKERVGGQRVVVTVADPDELGIASEALRPFADERAAEARSEREVAVPLLPGARLVEIVRALDAAGIDATDVERRGATLDDVYLTLTAPAPARAPEVIP